MEKKNNGFECSCVYVLVLAWEKSVCACVSDWVCIKLKMNSLKIKMLCSHLYTQTYNIQSHSHTHNTFYMQFQCERSHFVRLLSDRLRILFCWSLSHHLILYIWCVCVSICIARINQTTCLHLCVVLLLLLLLLYFCTRSFGLSRFTFFLSIPSSHTHIHIFFYAVRISRHIVMHIRYTDICHAVLYYSILLYAVWMFHLMRWTHINDVKEREKECEKTTQHTYIYPSVCV